MSQPWSVAHRGYSARCTENTVASHLAAIQAGADFVETDARMSADGDVFCIHDPDLSRIAGVALPVAEASTADLRAIALPGGERLMALPAFLAAVADRAGILIDMKTPDDAVVEEVLADVGAHGANSNLWLGLRELSQLRALRKHSDVNCVALLADYDTAGAWMGAGATALRVWEGDFSETLEERLRPLAPLWITAGGRRTPDKPGDIPKERLCRLVRRQVQAILLNDPTLLPQAAREVAS